MKPLDPIEALDKLGSTADKIAKNLLALKIKGRPVQASYCPIAIYLKKCGFVGAGISQNGIDFYDGDKLAAPLATPKPVANFITKFDSGNYPDLILKD